MATQLEEWRAEMEVLVVIFAVGIQEPRAVGSRKIRWGPHNEQKANALFKSA